MSSSVVFLHWTEWFGERRNNSHTDINRVYNIHTIYIIYMQSHESNSQLLPLYRNYVNQEQEIMILKEGSYGNFGPLQSSWVQFLPDFLWGSCCLILVFSVWCFSDCFYSCGHCIVIFFDLRPRITQLYLQTILHYEDTITILRETFSEFL